MKKIYAYIALAIASTGCLVNNPYEKVVDHSDLINYTSIQLGRCATMPAELIETMVDFEKYLNKSDEEKLLDAEFYGNVSFFGDDTYGVKSGTKSLYCIVDTGGKSIHEDGAEWEFSSISFYGNYTDESITSYFQDIIIEGGKLKTVDSKAGIWTFNAENIESKIIRVPSDSLQAWNIIGSCIENADNGMRSNSTTGEDGITYRKVMMDQNTVYPYIRASYSGTFTTEFFKGNEKVDWCMLAFRPGFNSTVTSSR